MSFSVRDATSVLSTQIYPDVTQLEKAIFFNIKHFQVCKWKTKEKPTLIDYDWSSPISSTDWTSCTSCEDSFRLTRMRGRKSVINSLSLSTKSHWNGKQTSLRILMLLSLNHMGNRSIQYTGRRTSKEQRDKRDSLCEWVCWDWEEKPCMEMEAEEEQG